MTRLKQFFAFSSLFLFFVSCHSSRDTNSQTAADTLVIGIESSPLTLDPRLATDAYSSKLSSLVHSGLFRLNERLEVIPNLVDSYEALSSTQYRFHLKAGVLFQDGHVLNADDVVYTYESTRDPKLASPFRGVMDKIDVIKAVDPLTLEISLKEPFAPFLSSLTMGILSREANNPNIGSGPFRVEEWSPAEVVRLARYDRYFKTKPKIAKLVFRVITDDNLRILELKKNHIDVLQNNIPPVLVSSLLEDAHLQMMTTEGINMTYLGLNLQNTFLSRVEVRQAIAYALDIPAIIEYRMAKLAKPAGQILSPIHWAFDPEVRSTEFDPEKAKKLLDQAGFLDPDGAGPRPRFSLTYKTSTKKDRIALARLIARYLGEVGIEVKVLPYEWGTFFQDINSGNFEMFSLTWVGVTEPDIYFSAFHSSQKPPVGANRGGYQNATVDQLSSEGRRSVLMEPRKTIYQELVNILANDKPIVPLWYEDNYVVFSKRIKGLKLRPNASFEWTTEVVKE